MEVIYLGVPFSTKQLNRAYSAYTPSTVHVTNTEMAYFYRRYLFQKAIAQVEGADEATCLVLEAAALVHDIGIKPALEIYGSSA